jgi:hypothetical protein
MKNPLENLLPVPPALVYLLHQLRENGIGYRLFGEVPDAEMVFVDLDRNIATNLKPEAMPERWSMISPHFLAHRALESDGKDFITDKSIVPEAVVISFGGREAEDIQNFQALCEQVRYLRQQSPSRLVYHSKEPPEPMEIHALIELIKFQEE